LHAAVYLYEYQLLTYHTSLTASIVRNKTIYMYKF